MVWVLKDMVRVLEDGIRILEDVVKSFRYNIETFVPYYRPQRDTIL